MSNLGKEQENILKWWYSSHRNKTFSPQEGYKQYAEEQEYQASDRTFNNLLLELYNRNLLEKPKHGQYQLSDQGKNKADYILNPEKYNTLVEEDLELKDQLVEFFDDYKEEKFYEKASKHEIFKLKFSELDKFNPEVVDNLGENTNKFREAVQKAAMEASEFNHIPPIVVEVDVDHFKIPIYKARSGKNIGDLVTVEGTLDTVYASDNICTSIKFECGECGQLITKEQTGEKKRRPYKCDCGSNNFQVVNEVYKDRLKFTVSRQKEEEEKIECKLVTDEISGRAKDILKPGNKVRVSGSVDVKEKSKDKNRIATPFINVLAFEQEDKTKDLSDFSKEKIDEVKSKAEGRVNPFNDFARSLAPEIVDSDNGKKVIAASLIGAPEAKDDGRIHSFIISNPGEGKSDMLKFNESVFHNTHYADGKNATGPGLTGTVEQQKGGQWKLKAGKIVYADQGVLALDEFDKMNRSDAEKLNTAMVQPSFPVDMAGTNAHLPGQATVIAAGNFQDYLEEDENKYIQEYIPDHAASLLDRFSLIYAMNGDSDSEKVEDAILSSFGDDKSVTEDTFFDEDELVIFREICRDIDPVLTETSREFIKHWLNGQKSVGDSKNDSSFNSDSNRYLVTLAKLTCMFARCRFAERTNDQDAQNAIKLVQMCRESRGLSDGESDIKKVEEQRNQNRISIVRDALEDLDSDGDGVMPEDIAERTPLDIDVVEDALDEIENEVHEVSPGCYKLL